MFQEGHAILQIKIKKHGFINAIIFLLSKMDTKIVKKFENGMGRDFDHLRSLFVRKSRE